jgi:hypothetical protein
LNQQALLIVIPAKAEPSTAAWLVIQRLPVIESKGTGFPLSRE